MNYYSFHIGDYRGATAHLSNDEDLCYRRILDMYYDKEGALPSIEIISRRARFPESLVQSILREFFIQTESGWMHDRAQKEIESYQLQSKGGKKGAEARWGKNGVPILPPCKPHMGLDSPPIVPLIATNNQEPITKNHIPPTPKGEKVEKVDEEFEAFWQSYPRKTGKGAARNAWAKAKRPAIEVILNALHKAKRSPDWLKEKGAYIPHPATWLNQGRWEDEGMDYEALTQKRVLGPSLTPQEAFQIDDHDALNWIAENYEIKAGVPYRDWPQNVQAEYRNQLKQLQAA